MMFILISLTFLSSCASNQEAPVETPEQKKALLFYQQGTQELIDKNYSNALGYLIKAKDLNPNHDEIRNNLGMAYFLKNQPEKAKDEFQKALSINSKNSDARNNYASILFHQKKYKEALSEYDKVASDLTYTKLFRVYFNMALIYNRLDNPELAESFLTKSIKENPDYCPAHFEMGNQYTQKYKFKDALESYREATKGSCVNEPAPHFEVAQTLIRLNRTGEAEAKFREILEKFPKNQYAILAREELSKISDERQVAKKLKEQTKSTDENSDSSDDRFQTPNF